MNDLLKAYIDNELSAEDRARLDADLSDNPTLLTELDEIRDTGLYLEASAKAIEIKGLDETLAALDGKPKRARWYRSPYAVLAGATCVVAVGMAMFPQGLTSPRLESVASKAMSAPAPASGAASVSSPAEESANMAPEAPSAGVDMARERLSDGFEAKAESQPPAQHSATKPRESGAASPNIPASDRQVIKTGSMNVRVKDIEPAASRVESIATQYGGYVESKNLSGSGPSRYAYFAIRVDSKFFEQALRGIRELGEVTSESTAGEDVTGQIADIGARLKQMRLEEAQYQEVLKSARRIQDILTVKQYISDIRQEIEATEAQLKTLKSLSSLSTVNVTLEQREVVNPAPRRDWLSNTWIQALNRFGSFGRVLVSAAINILVLAPFWGPFALAIWWWTRRKGRR